jgi:AmiR/NasT family two-component response regulator
MAQYDDLADKRIVICEDEGITVMQLERALTRAGLVVVGKASNGQDGVEIVLRERPDIVLMDIVMPGQDGLESMRQILAEFPTCVVMLTANSDDEHMEEARAIGAAGYIPKPVTAEHLLPALKQALQMFYECTP